MVRSIVIVGAGARGYCMLDVVERVNSSRPFTWEFVGYVDDSDDVGAIAPTSALPDLDVDAYLISIDRIDVRLRLDTDKPEPAIVIDPSAAVSTKSTAGPGLVVRANAVVDPYVTFGRHNLVGMGATLGHDLVMGNYAIVHPGANINGWVELGEGSTVGAGAVVLGERRVGTGAYVGAGSVVTRDVPDGATVVGVPAR